MQIDRLDHLVLTVACIKATVTFYTRVLGMQEVTFRGGRTALAFGSQKINLHEKGAEFEPKAKQATPGSADLCFITKYGMNDVRAHLQDQGIDILEGPVARTGATGSIQSIYVRDPDENLVEISVYETPLDRDKH